MPAFPGSANNSRFGPSSARRPHGTVNPVVVTMSNHLPRACALILLLAAAGSAPAQTGQPDTAHAESAAQSESAATHEARAARFQAGVERAAELLENNPRLAKL